MNGWWSTSVSARDAVLFTAIAAASWLCVIRSAVAAVAAAIGADATTRGRR